ncbi:hypothetical protein SM139_0697 [Stenotrophomonas maltophilia]|nr:hypothetical protein SM139_0697 [Stenotrophomonas maltophilia]
MFSQVLDGASTAPAWTAGGQEASAQWGVNVRADKKIGGVQLSATGEISAFDVLADMFRVSSPSAGMRTEFSDGNWRVYDQNGRLRMRWGGCAVINQEGLGTRLSATDRRRHADCDGSER